MKAREGPRRTSPCTTRMIGKNTYDRTFLIGRKADIPILQ